MNHYDYSKTTISLGIPRVAGQLQLMAPEPTLLLRRSSFDAVYVIDALAALLLLLLTLPVMLLGLLWVWLVDGGNPIFVQERIGLNGKPYRLFKIRSMHHDREGGDRFCSHGDDRIIKGGRFLRKTRIDELPQLINVLMGQMALVGPRPEQPSFVQVFSREIPSYDQRHRVKPGITGLAQIVQGYVDDTHGTRLKLKYDLLFIRNRSVKLWFVIVLGTVKVVLLGDGAR